MSTLKSEEDLWREQEEFIAERDRHVIERDRLDEEVKKLQHQLQGTTDENLKIHLQEELSITQAKREIAESKQEKADALSWQRYYEWVQEGNVELAQDWKKLADEWEDKVKINEEHLKKLESEKREREQYEKYNEARKDYMLPELSSKEEYTCAAHSSSCLVYVSRGFTQELSIETIIEPQLHPKLQANEIKLTPVVRILPQEIACSVNKPAIVELIKTMGPNRQNPHYELVPLYSLSDPFEWKKLAFHNCEMLQDHVVFKTIHFGYFTAIAQFSLPTASVTVEPKVSQPAQLMIQELPGFKMEIPPSSVQSKTKITATVHYEDPTLCGDQSNYSPASACVMLEPHNVPFKDRIMITMPILNYDQIKRNYPNIKLELWHTDNMKEGAPVKLKLAEESGITIHQDDNCNYLATAYVTHFSAITYLWDQIVSTIYWLNFFVRKIRGRCQAFMSRETRHGSCITFGIAVLLYPFKDPYSGLLNYPYRLFDSVLPITLVAGEIECQIKLDELLLQSYQSSRNQERYTKSCMFPKEFNMRIDFCIKLDATAAVGSELPAGNLATLSIKQGSDECNSPPPFLLIKPSATNRVHAETSNEPVAPENSGLGDNEPQVSTHPIELAACQLIKTTKQLKENVMVEAARRIAEHMTAIVQLACTPESDEESSKDALFDTVQCVIKESLEINKTAREVAAACTEQGLKKNVLEVVDKIPAIAGQLRIISRGTKMETYSKEIMVEAIDLLTNNAKNLIHAVEEVLYATERAIIKLPASEKERLNLIHQTTPDSLSTPHLDAVPTLATLSMLQTPQGKKIQIIKRMAPHWRDLGALMDFDQIGTELATIDSKHHGDPKECCRAVFQHWVKGTGVRPCSWRKLIKLIDNCDQEALAEEIQTALSS